MSLYYIPLFYVAFARVFRERGFHIHRALRLTAIAASGFVVFMLLMRVTGHNFEQTNHLGRVVIAGNEELRRDFGLGSAFIIYPMLALGAVAYSVYGRFQRSAVLLAAIGVLATLLTLIRGEIFGLAVGVIAMLLMRPRRLGPARRGRSILALAGCLCIAFLGVASLDPTLAGGMLQRSLPGLTHQSAYADSTAEYRAEAFQAGLASAQRHPAGIGFVSLDEVAHSGTDPNFVAHSTPAWFLVYSGWLGLAVAVLAALAVLQAGLRARSCLDWTRAAFVGTWLMLVVTSLAAEALVGQPWIIMLAAMALALRVSPSEETA
jgi:hypothetical protein